MIDFWRSHEARNFEIDDRPIPLLFKEGWTRHQMMSRSHLDLERTGWLFRNREAHLILLKLLTTPSAPLRNGSFFFVSQTPLLGKEGNVDRIQFLCKAGISCYFPLSSGLRPFLYFGSIAAISAR